MDSQNQVLDGEGQSRTGHDRCLNTPMKPPLLSYALVASGRGKWGRSSWKVGRLETRRQAPRREEISLFSSLAPLPRLKSEIHVKADVSEGEGVPE
jgi:hypothetical protein